MDYKRMNRPNLSSIPKQKGCNSKENIWLNVSLVVLIRDKGEKSGWRRPVVAVNSSSATGNFSRQKFFTAERHGRL